MSESVKRKITDAASAKAKLGQISAQISIPQGNKGNVDNGSWDDLSMDNWPQAVLGCGSNAYHQLSAEYFELMDPNFSIVRHRSILSLEIYQIACSGNQTAVLVGPALPNISLQGDAQNTSEGEVALQQKIFLWGSGRTATQMKVPVAIPPKCTIAQLSCGHSHAGFVTDRGSVFTWGSGDHGMLGHGTKSNVNEPRRIDSMKSLICTAISCGAYHTGIIACTKNDTNFIRFPQNSRVSSSVPVGNAGSRLIASEEYSASGQLYMCGLGKAGQLGVGPEILPASGANAGCLSRPTLVGFFESEGARIIKVSCGFHHTLVIAVPAQAMRIFSPSIYSFGYGEFGRLGLGNEEQVGIPTMVEFPAPFHPVHISAGEQHSLAAGKEGCYAWGCNDMGQLGCCSPSQMEFSAVPVKVPIPEGMTVRRISAGGRHSGAVTYCGNVLTWGWGEEGQLGHGTEKSSYIPKPSKLPSLFGGQSCPMDIALGGTHSLISVHNPKYLEPVAPVPEEMPKAPDPIVEEPEPTAPLQPPVPDIVDVTQSIEVPTLSVAPPVEPKPPMLADDEDEEPEPEPRQQPPPPICSIKDILQQREERKAREQLIELQDRNLEENPVKEEEPVVETETEVLVLGTESIVPPVEVVPEPIDQEIVPPTDTECHIQEEELPSQVESLEEGPAAPVNKINVFYKDGQNLDNCLVANYAKRAEIRKQRKASVTSSQTNQSGKAISGSSKR